MKNDPISTHERVSIIQQLAATGKWKAIRGGATIEIARFPTQHQRVKPTFEATIHYSVSFAGHLIVSARAKTVGEAVSQCNVIILGRRRPDPMAGRTAHPEHTGTPHLVRARHRHAGETGELWGEQA